MFEVQGHWPETGNWGVCLCAAFEGAPEDVDITMFETQGTEADAIGRAAADLVAKVRTDGCFPYQCGNLCSNK